MAVLLQPVLSASVPALVAFPVTILIIVFVNLIYRLHSGASLPKHMPWVGTRGIPGGLGRAWANISSIFHLRDLLDEGYCKYSKSNQTYVLPYYINGPQVMLPTSQMAWLLSQSDNVLSQEHVNRQFLQADYTFLHATKVDNPVHPEVIHHQLTRGIHSFADEIAEEARETLDSSLGVDAEEWVDVNVYEVMLDLVARLSTRVLVGLPLCRDPAFLKACSSFIRKVILPATAISIFPSFLRPLVAPIFTFYDYIQYRRCAGSLLPLIRERLDRTLNMEKLVDSQPRGDYIQWAIDHALAKSVVNPVELDPQVIACRFSVLAFAAIQSSVITLTNTLFDLAASPDCARSLAVMHDEVRREAAATASPWSKTALSRMTHIDSALRESLRLNGFIERGVMKMVVAPGGVTLPDGSHVPYGTKVGVSGYSVHRDEANYPNATKYDAFRFVGGKDGPQKKPLGLVNTSEEFLGFSHGSHACPGRFFAANQLKIALAHIALLYEIEPIPERPKNRWFFGHIAPPLSSTLRFKRRRLP